MQGVGAVGIAGVAGNAIVSGDGGVRAQQDSAALRVVHASPDAPPVTARLEEAGTGGLAGTDTDNGTGGFGGGNETETESGGGGLFGGNETETGTETDGDDGEDGPLVENLSFSEVSDYSEVDPGTYQLQIVATESTGFLEGIFGGGDNEEQVVYDEQVELESGTTYTAVAYGKLAEADLGDGGVSGEGTPTDDGFGGNETGGGLGGDNETGGVIGEETETEVGGGLGGDNETGGGLGGDNETGGFGEETETEAGGVIGEETPTDDGAGQGTSGGEVLVEGLAFGEYEYVEVSANAQMLEFHETQVQGDGSGEMSPDGGLGEGTPTDDGFGGNETGGGLGGDNETGGFGEETETEAGGVIGEETPDGGLDGSTPAGGASGQASDRAFQVAILEDQLEVTGETGGLGGETSTDDGLFGGNETETETETESGGGGLFGGGNETETEADGAGQGTDGESGTAWIRIFNAVPDVEALTVVAVEDDGGNGGLFGGGNETETETETESGDGGLFGGNETETDDGLGGDGVGEETPTDDGLGGDNGTGDGFGPETPEGGVGQGQEQTRVREVAISPEAGTVYSGFAMGYFDPQTAEQAGTETPSGGLGDNETGGGLGDNETGGGLGEETETEAGGVIGEETETETDGDGGLFGGGDNETETGEETETDGLAEDASLEAFEFVIVEDATDGERADGGTGSGGIFSAASDPQASSD